VLFAAGLALAALAAVAWYQLVYIGPRYSPADPLALAALHSNSRVTVTSDRWIVLEPAAGVGATGLVFYPGGQVAPEGYAEPLHAVAAAGYLVVLVPMPLDLAILAPDRADEVIAAFPQVRRWVIAGHSLGGAMAARYVFSHPGRVAGLLLWDAYPPDTDDLSGAALPVRQVARVGADGQLPGSYREVSHLLPASTQVVTLPGATHMNYGRFIAADRFRNMDSSITTGSMPIDEQHERVVAATLEFLAQVGASAGTTPGGTP
jgi:hypothetical protein